MNEFYQNSSSAEHNHQTVSSSENTAVNLNPNAQFLNLNFTEVKKKTSNTVKETLRDVNLVRKFLKSRYP